MIYLFVTGIMQRSYLLIFAMLFATGAGSFEWQLVTRFSFGEICFCICFFQSCLLSVYSHTMLKFLYHPFVFSLSAIFYFLLVSYNCTDFHLCQTLHAWPKTFLMFPAFSFSIRLTHVVVVILPFIIFRKSFKNNRQTLKQHRPATFAYCSVRYGLHTILVTEKSIHTFMAGVSEKAIEREKSTTLLYTDGSGETWWVGTKERILVSAATLTSTLMGEL